jgi:hypothetical protein
MQSETWTAEPPTREELARFVAQTAEASKGRYPPNQEKLSVATHEMVTAEMRRVANKHGSAVISEGPNGLQILPHQGSTEAAAKAKAAKDGRREKNRKARKARRKQRG